MQVAQLPSLRWMKMLVVFALCVGLLTIGSGGVDAPGSCPRMGKMACCGMPCCAVKSKPAGAPTQPLSNERGGARDGQGLSAPAVAVLPAFWCVARGNGGLPAKREVTQVMASQAARRSVSCIWVI